MAGDRGKRSSERAALVVYAMSGALLAIVVLGILVAAGQVKMPGAPVAPQASIQAPAQPAGSCPLRTSSPMCDACMQERCKQSCASCADDPDCIALFLCVLDCREPACSRGCAERYPGATAALEAFAGEQGCMRKCRDACR